MDSSIKKLLKHNYEKGVSLLEALFATALVGIGFVAVFQIVNYSTSSVNVSSERTKMNYIVSMVAEDLIGYNSSLVGVNPQTSNIELDEHRRPIDENGVISSVKKFPQKYIDDGAFKVEECDTTKDRFKDFTKNTSIYENNPAKSAAHNKNERLEKILKEDRYLKCISSNDTSKTEDIKRLEVFKICNDTSDGCKHTVGKSDHVYDEIYIGRVQVNTNKGKKKKILYFQADYIYKNYE